MNPLPYIPDTAPFTAEQRAWLNGFLAGWCSQAPAGKPANPPAAPSGEPLLVLFGSQTGTAETLAKRLAKDSESRGFAPKLAPLNDFESAGFADANKAVIISSTWGDGDPPDNAATFWSWLQADAAPRLHQLRFAVLGLGDRNYSDFCGASRKIDTRLEALGAKRLTPRGECDTDYEAAAHAWMDALWAHLRNGGSDGATPAGQASTNNGTRETHHSPAKNNGANLHGKSNPFPARLLRNVLLNQPGSAKEVRHYELSLQGSGLSYEAGDALGVLPVNCPALVEDILSVLGADPNENVKFGDRITSLREALTHHLDITRPSPELLAAVAKAAPHCELASLLAPEKRAELKDWLWGRHIIDLLHLHPIPVMDLVPILKRLTARLYSISSSPKAHPDEVHLTVSAVRYDSHGRARKGVASTFLADRVGDAEFVKIFVQPSHGFKPPANRDLPMIMVGPGTGIAPFRAFLEERQATGAKGGNWLFFGDQKHSTDFLYREQLTAWQASGLLNRLDLAFSRDQPEKIYVQDRMLQHAAEVWSWLDAGAHFYVCGDAGRMAKDVDAALHRIVETAGGRSADDAKAFVANLKATRRYQRDVY